MGLERDRHIGTQGPSDSERRDDPWLLTRAHRTSVAWPKHAVFRDPPFSELLGKSCDRVGHLRETVRILRPTVCVVQSTRIPGVLVPIVTRRREVAPHLAEVTIGGVQTLMAEFSHPTAYADLNWGRWTNMPYLQNTVIPALREARARLGLPAHAPTFSGRRS